VTQLEEIQINLKKSLLVGTSDLLILNISEKHDCFLVLRPLRPMTLLDSQL